MTDRDAMLAAICENQDEDTPRLVYADWLDDNGEPERAEFIRVKCELARVPYCSSCDPEAETVTDYDCGHDDVRAKLRRRERELWQTRLNDGYTLGYHWFTGPTSISTAFASDELTYRITHTPLAFISRGFISHIRCSWADFLRVESRLIWVPGGTVEVESGICHCGEECETHHQGSGHSPVDMPDRIPRPFVSSMQPITRVELTTWPVERDAQGIYSHMTTPEGYRFTRLKCEKCNGQRRLPPPAGGQMMPRECEKCEGQPLNEWTCVDWPGVTFAMPEAVAQYDPRLTYLVVRPDGTMIATSTARNRSS